MKVRAAVLESVGASFQVQQVDLGEPQAGEVLVRMLATGVCHSDWNLVTGDTKHPMPLVAGHEGAGIVEQVVPSRESRVPRQVPGGRACPRAGLEEIPLFHRRTFASAYACPLPLCLWDFFEKTLRRCIRAGGSAGRKSPVVQARFADPAPATSRMRSFGNAEYAQAQVFWMGKLERIYER